MSRKRTRYSTKLKTQLVLEILKGDKTLNEIASENSITPKNLQNWKRQFLENAEAMEPSKAVSEYKEEIKELKSKNDKYAKVVGKLTVEKEWAVGKLKSLGLNNKKALIEPKLKELSISKQCKIVGLNRGSLYYKSKKSKKRENIKKEIVRIYEEIPIYGSTKVHQQLLENGYSVSSNTVFKYRKELNLKAILAEPISKVQSCEKIEQNL